MAYEKLTDKDLYMIDTYRRTYSDGIESNYCDIETLLSRWNYEKNIYLYKLLGEELIYTKEVSLQASEHEIDNMMFHIRNTSKFYSKVCDYISKTYFDDSVWDIYDDISELFNTDILTSNRAPKEFDFSINDTVINVKKGMKLMKIFKKMARCLNADDDFEEFRLEHSRALNHKGFDGKLCLSIHPLDYMTMSDNENDWHSCMSWRHNGDYRQGTVEMMNSSCVIVAYLVSAENEMTIGNYKWNSKKWRKLFIVDRDFMAGVKGYPYDDKNLDMIVYEIINELLQKNNPFNEEEVIPYLKPDYYEVEQGYINENIPEGLDREEPLEFCFECGGAMYNDMYERRFIALRNTPIWKTAGCYYYDYCGESQCMCCGGYFEVRYDENESCLVCSDCNNSIRCCWCGRNENVGEAYYINGGWYCPDCYDELFAVCDKCGEIYRTDNCSDSMIFYSKEKGFAYRTWIQDEDMCCDCLRKAFEPYKVNGKARSIYYGTYSYRDIYNLDIMPQELIDKYDIDMEAENEYNIILN